MYSIFSNKLFDPISTKYYSQKSNFIHYFLLKRIKNLQYCIEAGNKQRKIPICSLSSSLKVS